MLLAGAAEKERQWDKRVQNNIRKSSDRFFSSTTPLVHEASISCPALVSTGNNASSQSPSRRSKNKGSLWREMWAANMACRKSIREVMSSLRTHFPRYQPRPMHDAEIDRLLRKAIHESSIVARSIPNKKRKRAKTDSDRTLSLAKEMKLRLDLNEKRYPSNDDSLTDVKLPEDLREFYRTTGASLEKVHKLLLETSRYAPYYAKPSVSHTLARNNGVAPAQYESEPWLPYAPTVFLSEVGYPHWLLVLSDPAQGYYAVNCDYKSKRFGCVALFEPSGDGAYLRYHSFEEFLSAFVEGVTGPLYQGFSNRNYLLPLFDPMAVKHLGVRRVEKIAPFQMNLPDVRNQYQGFRLLRDQSLSEFLQFNPDFRGHTIFRRVNSHSSREDTEGVEDDIMLLNPHNGFLVRGKSAVQSLYSCMRLDFRLEFGSTQILFVPCRDESDLLPHGGVADVFVKSF